MTDIFLHILNQSLAAGWLILAVLVLRLILKKAPKWITCILWALVAVRLFLPFTLESAFSLIPSAETVSADIMYEKTPAINSGISVINNSVNPVISNSFAPNMAASVNPLQIWFFIAGIVWIVGIVGMLLYAAASYVRLRLKVRTAVKWKENLWQSEYVNSPFILGIFRPRIYLPYNMEEKEAELVTAHERAHLKRHDHWWKPWGFVILAIYWFHPLCWIAYWMLCKDIELACDEKVIRDYDTEQKKSYSEVLLNCSVNHRSISACPLAFGEVGVKERIRSVLNYKKPAFWVIVAAIVICIVVAVCFLTNPKRETMNWANSLRADDVETIELVVMPQSVDKQYKLLNAEETRDAVSLIRESRGTYVAEPDAYEGENIALYITMKDGTKHEVMNIGNVYLAIDDDYYDAEYNWLSGWRYEEGDSSLPQGFYDDAEWEETDPGAGARASLVATVKEITGDTMLVAAVADSPELSSAQLYWIPMRFMAASPEPQIGDVIEIRYDGVIMESDPAQLGEIYSITVITDNSGTGNANGENAIEGNLKEESVNGGNATEGNVNAENANASRAYEGSVNEENAYESRAYEENTEYSNTAAFTPEDIHDLVEIQMSIGSQRLFCEDADAIKWVENAFSKAEVMPYIPGCSFEVQLILIREDGTEMVVYPATDSCDVFRCGNSCYDFGNSDNSEFWGLFDGWYDRILEVRENSSGSGTQRHQNHHADEHH